MTKIKNKAPKYQQIAERLIQQIIDQQFAIGDLLPTEKELCESFKASRHTIREALRHVEKTGLVDRRQGSGTKVIRTEVAEQINQFVNSVEDLMEFASHTKFEVRTSETLKADPVLAEMLRCPTGKDCIRVGGLRIESQTQLPVCYSNIYRTAGNESIDRKLSSKKTAIYGLLEALDASHIGKIEQQLSACIVNCEMSKLLATGEDKLAMKIVRRYYSKGRGNLILVAESIYPANRFTYSSVLYPD